MSEPLPNSHQIRQLVGGRPVLDAWTAALITAMSAGFPLLGVLYHRGQLPAWAAVVGATLLMNLSFTAWHEPAHQNFSRLRWLNAAAGWIASFASVYPGYFARRREHLEHHKFEGIEGKDPVYPRVQSGFWTFPLTLVLAAVRGARRPEEPVSFMPLTAAQRISDAVSNLLALSVIATSVWLGFWPAVVLVWVVPRLIIFGVHAYYICFFPHHRSGEGFVVLRLRPDRPVWRFLTMNQHLHGLHHRWPWIPWHKYRRVLRSFPQTFEATDAPADASPLLAAEGGKAP